MKIEAIEAIARRIIADENNKKKVYNEWEEKHGLKRVKADDDNHNWWVKGVESLLENIIKERS